MIIVDASVALAWVLPDTAGNHHYSARIADAGIDGTEELAAPRVLIAECGYRLLKFGRQHRWGEAKIAEAAELIDSFDLHYESVSPLASLVRFGVRHHVTGYDAIYLGLAMSLEAKLATLDGGLKTAARAAGVVIA